MFFLFLNDFFLLPLQRVLRATSDGDPASLAQYIRSRAGIGKYSTVASGVEQVFGNIP
jgi:hypothetical protein